MEAVVKSLPTPQSETETIVAIATAPGRGGIGIIRLSGPNSLLIAQTCAKKKLTPRYAHFSKLFSKEGEIIDEGVLIYFNAPHSFTGEEVVEIQTHGSPIVLEKLIQEFIFLGARLANPGEFSLRAFLNNKMDLTQAEAIADLINAQSEQAARNAMRSLQGVFSQKISDLVEQLIGLRIFVEAAIDFPDEEIDFLHWEQIKSQLQGMMQALDVIFKKANQGRLLQEGMTLVIAGKPNAGKSSLMNYLAGEDIAIVTDIPGTTRDAIQTQISLDGLVLQIMDTAGLRETDDFIEAEGVRRSLNHVNNADRVLLMIDATTLDLDSELTDWWPNEIGPMPDKKKITVIFNKMDLLCQEKQRELENREFSADTLMVSLKDNMNVEIIRDYLKKSIGYCSQHEEDQFSARRRHLDALSLAKNHIQTAHDFIDKAKVFELLAEELRLAQTVLNTITGEFGSDDLLGEIFSSFCIGK